MRRWEITMRKFLLRHYAMLGKNIYLILLNFFGQHTLAMILTLFYLSQQKIFIVRFFFLSPARLLIASENKSSDSRRSPYYHILRFIVLFFSQADKPEKYDLALVSRYGILGSTVFPSFLFYWWASVQTVCTEKMKEERTGRVQSHFPPRSVGVPWFRP